LDPEIHLHAAENINHHITTANNHGDLTFLVSAART